MQQGKFSHKSQVPYAIITARSALPFLPDKDCLYFSDTFWLRSGVFQTVWKTRLEITATFLNNHRMNFQEIREKSWSGGNGSALRAVITDKLTSNPTQTTEEILCPPDLHVTSKFNDSVAQQLKRSWFVSKLMSTACHKVTCPWNLCITIKIPVTDKKNVFS